MGGGGAAPPSTPSYFESQLNECQRNISERQMQRHLNKAGTADGVLQFTQVARRRANISAGAGDARREARKTVYRRVREEGIEIDIVAGDVEARVIEDVEGDY